jgi:hypothetical protein
MNLREFSKKHISADTVGYLPRWRRVLPTELRFYETVVKKRVFFPDKIEYVLQEKWERIHKGDVIDTEWRPVETVYTQFDY